jgi:long-chain acyl-CoA synthetase
VDVLNDCAARCVLVDDAFLGQAAALQAAVKSLALVVYIGAAEERSALPAGVLHWGLDLASKGDPGEAAPCGGDDVYGLFYTGGTTGKSKGVMLTHNNLMSNAYCMLHGLGYSRDTTYLHCAPMFHLADGANTFAVTMVGGKHVFVKRFVPGDVALSFKTQRVSHVLMVPSMIQMLLSFEEFDAMAARGDFSALRVVLYGASPMPEAMLVKAMQAFGSAVSWYQGYGQTESAPVNTLLGPEEHRKGGVLLKSAGRPVPHAEVRIVDEQDCEVPLGSVGELVVRGPHIMKGYWNMPELTAATLKGGWLHSGDGAYMDKDGYIFIADRIKDMIKTGGENVFSAEVESCVSKLPGVQQCAVIGVPDDMLVEKVAAIVIRQPGSQVSEAEIVAHCKQNIAGYKVPRVIVFRDEPLPLSGAGKVLKTELRKPFWSGNARSDIYSSNVDRKTEYK